jgi:hypothetical protein
MVKPASTLLLFACLYRPPRKHEGRSEYAIEAARLRSCTRGGEPMMERSVADVPEWMGDDIGPIAKHDGSQVAEFLDLAPRQGVG